MLPTWFPIYNCSLDPFAKVICTFLSSLSFSWPVSPTTHSESMTCCGSAHLVQLRFIPISVTLSVVLFLALEMVTSTLCSVGLLQCKCFSQAAVYPLLAMGFLCVFILNNFLFHRNVTWPVEVFFWNAFHMYTQLSHLQAWISWSYPFFPVQILSLNIVRIKYLNPGNVSPGETHDLRAFKRSDGYWLNWLKAVIIQFWFTG